MGLGRCNEKIRLEIGGLTMGFSCMKPKDHEDKHGVWFDDGDVQAAWEREDERKFNAGTRFVRVLEVGEGGKVMKDKA